jgi:hypothetical protein
LLEFLRRDLGTLRRQEWCDLRADAVRFLCNANPAAIIPTDAPNPYTIALAKRQGQRVAETTRPAVTDNAVLVNLQTTLRASVGRLSTPWLRWVVPFDKPPRWVLERREDGTLSRRYQGELPTVLLASAADLLVTGWPLLRTCACDVLFRPSHGRQRYHDKPCASRHRWIRFASSRPKRDYHEEYKRRVKGGTPRRRPKKMS